MAPRRIVEVALLFTVALLGACGGGGSGGPQEVAPSDLSYPPPAAFVKGQAIKTLTPTVSGTVSSYTVSPALPPGLALNATTGSISGTPTAVTALGKYTVTAGNPAGATSTELSIVVNDVLPSIAYAAPYYSFSIGVGIPAISAQQTGGQVLTWTITPALPAGLAFNSANGSITGTPTTAAAATAFTVTAANSGGDATASLTIAVSPQQLLDIGHSGAVTSIQFSGSNALTEDYSGHWILWDFQTGAMLASGSSVCTTASCVKEWTDVCGSGPPEPAFKAVLAGSSLVVQTQSGFEVRSALDGQVISEIPVENIPSPCGPPYAANLYWQVATDGSYIANGTSNGLTLWSPSGQVLVNLTGDYSNAPAFAAPEAVRLALGPAGQNVVQTITVPGGTSVVSAQFQGQFQSWFADGGSFLTTLSNTVWVYSNTGVQEDLQALPSLINVLGIGGMGNWFWTYGSNFLNLYAVGSNSQPVASYSFAFDLNEVIPSAVTMTLGLLNEAQGMSILDLSSTVPVINAYSAPIPYLSAYGAASSSEWMLGNVHGVLVDGSTLSGQPRYLDYGEVWSIAGSSARVAIATASGRILYFNAVTNALEGTINYWSSSLSMSSDGSVLAATGDELDAQYGTDSTINIYALPVLSTLNSLPGGQELSITLSGSGSVLGELQLQEEICAFAALTGATILCDATTQPVQVQLSPDGTLMAASTGVQPSVVTNIYQNGTLVTAVPGVAEGWLDDTRLLMGNFVADAGGYNGYEYSGSSIYSSTGVLLASPSLPELPSFQVVSPQSVYSPHLNSIISLTNGTVLWKGTYPIVGSGAVYGSHVAYASGNSVLTEAY